MLLLTATSTRAQQFSLQTTSDTLSHLILSDKGRPVDQWKLPFPVYQLQVGDIDGDGRPEALVGVVKTTRYDPVEAKRLFIFKCHHGRIRALWMGSRLGGILEDFRFSSDGHVVTLQSTTDGRYVVLEHEWRRFGLGALRFLARGVSLEDALSVFPKNSIDSIDSIKSIESIKIPSPIISKRKNAP